MTRTKITRNGIVIPIVGAVGSIATVSWFAGGVVKADYDATKDRISVVEKHNAGADAAEALALQDIKNKLENLDNNVKDLKATQDTISEFLMGKK